MRQTPTLSAVIRQLRDRKDLDSGVITPSDLSHRDADGVCTHQRGEMEMFVEKEWNPTSRGPMRLQKSRTGDPDSQKDV